MNAPVPADAAASLTQGGDRPPLLCFATDAHTDGVLREVLLAEAGDGAAVRRGDLRAAIKALTRSPTPHALVVDVSGIEQPLGALEELAQVVEPDVRVLVVGDREDAAFYRALTRGLGVLEYLYKPLTPDMVARHFVQHLRGGTLLRAVRGGRVIAVQGVRGGAGCTTIAANLAWHFAEEARRFTALLDADLHAGTAALVLGTRASPGLRAALEDPDRVDELFVERAAQPVGERLHVLAGEERLAEIPTPRPGAGARLVSVLRRRCNFVVLDLGARPTALGRELMEQAHQRIFVLEPSLAGVRDALRWAALSPAPQQVRRAVLVLNRSGQPGCLTDAKVDAALGSQPDLRVPFLPKLLPGAADLGEPAAARRGPFRDAIAKLAQEVASVRAPEVEIAAPARRGWSPFRRTPA